jgi:hypothetical protein
LENMMKSKSNPAAMARPHVPLRGRRTERLDASLAEESADVGCLDRLSADAARSAQDVDDGMNATEASEERHAAAEAHAMR